MKYLLVLLLFISSGVSSAQEVTATGNIIDPSKWNNVIPMTASQLSQVEGSGGGPLPAYNLDTNTIRFSFMPYTVSQVRAIDQVLSGQGISVVGFNYSWKIYNDLLNCCSTRGTLSVTGQLADKSGNVLQSYFYDYSNTNTGANFQTFSGTETFNNPYKLENLGYIGIAWTGKDQNFWSGYYGPRVREPSITLNYTVKSSTTTSPTPTVPTLPPPPNDTATTTTFGEVSTNNTNPMNTSTNDPVSMQSQPPPNDNNQPPTQQQQQQQQQQNPGNQNQIIVAQQSPSPVSNITDNQNTNKGPVQDIKLAVNQQGPSNQNQSVANTDTKAPVERQISPSASTSSTISTSSILAMIQANQARDTAAAVAVTQQVNQIAQQVVQQTERSALDVANNSSVDSQKVTQEFNKSENKIENKTKDNAGMNTGIALIGNTPTATVNPSLSLTQNNNTLPNQPVNNSASIIQANRNSQVQTNSIVSPIIQSTNLFANTSITTGKVETVTGGTNNNFVQEGVKKMEVLPIIVSTNTIKVENTNALPVAPVVTQSVQEPISYKLLPPSMPTINQSFENVMSSTLSFANKTDPLQDYVEKNSVMASLQQPEVKQTTIRSNVQDNDAAGNVKIERLATVPSGFNTYSNLTLSNIAFYEPKEIYKNQKVIDNAKALRQLSSDRLHQEMVEQQYRR